MGEIKTGISSFIGEVLLGQSYPVFFDTHLPISTIGAPVTLITGSPGSGKTFFGMLLAAQASVMDKISFIIDPKGDFVQLYRLYELGEINEVNVWSVVSINKDKEIEVSDVNTGVLDPLYIEGSDAQKSDRTLRVIKSLVGGITNKQENYITPLIQDEVKQTHSNNASLMNVANRLYSNQDEDIRAMGTKLRMILQLPISKLICADKKIPRRQININNGTFVASLAGFKLPSPDKAEESYTSEEKVSVILMTLITDLAMNIMINIPGHEKQKIIFIDEAWSVKASEQGNSLINNAALLGRSMNQALILLTQSPYHLVSERKGGPNLENSISTRFAFRNTSMEDNRYTVESMKLSSDANWESRIAGLPIGACLMQDFMGQAQFIDVLAPDKWADAFETNPIKKRRQNREES